MLITEQCYDYTPVFEGWCSEDRRSWIGTLSRHCQRAVTITWHRYVRQFSNCLLVNTDYISLQFITMLVILITPGTQLHDTAEFFKLVHYSTVEP